MMTLNFLSRKLVYFIIYYNLFCGFAIKNLGINKSCLFLIDILYIIILLIGNFKINKTDLKLPITIFALLLSTLFLGVVLNGVDLPNFIWGLRNQYLSLILFFASASFLRIINIDKIFKFFFYFQILNLLCALYQYFILGYYADNNNGAFINGNGQDIFCGTLVTYYLYTYMNHKCKLWHFIFVIASSLIIAALEEEKFIFIETVLVFVYFYLTSKRLDLKKIVVAVVLIVIFAMGLNLLSNVGGMGSLEILTNKDAFMAYQENAYALPRVGSSPILSKMFFFKDWQCLFGLGIGMCEESSTLSFIDSSFYDKYSWLNYNWFTFHISFLQTGWLGILLFISFFLSILIYNFRNKRKCPKELNYYYDISNIIIILCLITIWYNSTLRSYNSIIPYFAMSIGPIVNRQVNKYKK